MAGIQSMTGYGKSSADLSGKKITIELKTLNSKQSDVNWRLPQEFKPAEAELRQVTQETLERGKVDATLTCEITGPEAAPKINEALALSYLRQFEELSVKAGVKGDALSALLRFPDIFRSPDLEIKEEEWDQLLQCLREALDQVQQYRREEGARLQADLQLRLNAIAQKMDAITPLEKERTQQVRQRLEQNIARLQVNADQDRLEQELMYYLEKLDITEEKVRLSSHLHYFEELMHGGGEVGKKLGFVGQEIGREINTLGSKANHAAIQKLVVEMKDELEKIKEQVLNIL